MFNGAEAFNQTIGKWTTSNVTDMNDMFNGAALFNQPIGNWTTSKVTYMNSMFQNASLFNQCLGEWARSSDNVDVSDMFLNSSCKFTSDPNSTISPWCRECS